MAKKKTNDTSDTMGSIDLAKVLSDSLNKKFSKKLGHDIVYKLPDDFLENGTVPYYISTGNFALDLAISNKRDGGLPAGRIIEFTGLEQSGKTLISAHILAETQKIGGYAIYIDTEHSFLPEYFGKVCGIDFNNNWLHIEMDDLETIFEIIEQVIIDIRSTDKDIPVTIVLDSIMGASTPEEISAGYGKEGYATSKSIILSKAMRKLTNVFGREIITFVPTNQLRYNVNASMPGQDKYITSGGKAIDFHSSVKVRMQKIRTITHEDKYKIKQKIGNLVKCSIKKNRLGPPEKTINFNLFYDSGMDDIQSTLDLAKDYKLISAAGAYYDYAPISGEKIRFQKSEFKDIFNGETGLLDELKDRIAERYIMEYTDKAAPDTSIKGEVSFELDNDD